MRNNSAPSAKSVGEKPRTARISTNLMERGLHRSSTTDLHGLILKQNLGNLIDLRYLRKLREILHYPGKRKSGCSMKSAGYSLLPRNAAKAEIILPYSYPSAKADGNMHAEIK